jgi:hypothetical protein
MQALIDFLLSLPSFQARLIALGWKPPEVGTKGGGPGTPPTPV